MTKTPGNHKDSKLMLQKKYFMCDTYKDVPLLAFIGRVTRQKGVHLILEAAESLIFDFQYNIQILVGGMADSK
jgi:glycogen synthase